MAARFASPAPGEAALTAAINPCSPDVVTPVTSSVLLENLTPKTLFLPSAAFAFWILSSTSFETPDAARLLSTRSLMRNSPLASCSGVFVIFSPIDAPYQSTRNESPVSVIPNAILVGVDGSLPRRSRNPQNQTNGKVRIRTHIALMEFEIVPVTFQSVLSSAK